MRPSGATTRSPVTNIDFVTAVVLRFFLTKRDSTEVLENLQDFSPIDGAPRPTERRFRSAAARLLRRGE
jgi:hypothetical protein